jgi:hypothetical protein
MDPVFEAPASFEFGRFTILPQRRGASRWPKRNAQQRMRESLVASAWISELNETGTRLVGCQRPSRKTTNRHYLRRITDQVLGYS